MPTPRPGSRKASLQPGELSRALLPKDFAQQEKNPRRASVASPIPSRTPRTLPSSKATPSLSPRSQDSPRHLKLDLAPEWASFSGRTSPPGLFPSLSPSPHPHSARPLSPHPFSPHPLSPQPFATSPMTSRPRSSRSRTPQSGRHMPCTWSEYVQALQDKGFVSRAAVFSLQGKQWAATQDFQVKKDEVLRLVEGYPDTSELTRKGLVLGGNCYTLTRLCAGPMFVGRDCATGGGCVLYRCHSCLLLAQFDDHAHSAICFSVIEKLGDFLRERGL